LKRNYWGKSQEFSIPRPMRTGRSASKKFGIKGRNRLQGETEFAQGERWSGARWFRSEKKKNDKSRREGIRDLHKYLPTQLTVEDF